jgi:hypothetical protein
MKKSHIHLKSPGTYYFPPPLKKKLVFNQYYDPKVGIFFTASNKVQLLKYSLENLISNSLRSCVEASHIRSTALYIRRPNNYF